MAKVLITGTSKGIGYDTTLLLAGALFCQSYFDRDEPAETEIRALAEELYRAKNPKSAKSYHSSMLPTTPAAIPRCTVFGVRNSWVMTLPGTIGGGIGIVVIGRRSGSRSYATRPSPPPGT